MYQGNSPSIASFPLTIFPFRNFDMPQSTSATETKEKRQFGNGDTLTAIQINNTVDKCIQRVDVKAANNHELDKQHLVF